MTVVEMPDIFFAAPAAHAVTFHSSAHLTVHLATPPAAPLMAFIGESKLCGGSGQNSDGQQENAVLFHGVLLLNAQMRRKRVHC